MNKFQEGFKKSLSENNKLKKKVLYLVSRYCGPDPKLCKNEKQREIIKRFDVCKDISLREILNRIEDTENFLKESIKESQDEAQYIKNHNLGE